MALIVGGLARRDVGKQPALGGLVDEGRVLDVEHPEFAGRVVLEQSFVGGDITDRASMRGIQMDRGETHGQGTAFR